MTTVFLYVGAICLAVGSAGLGLVLLRYARGSVPGWKAAVEALFGVSAVVVGLYLILDMDILLPVWVGLVAVAGVYDARKKRELSEQSAGDASP